jgi:hypothetical protein
MVSSLILLFPIWNVHIHVHVYASNISLGVVLGQPVEGDLDHPIYFARRMFPQDEHKHTINEREGLAMVYTL